VPVGLVLRCPGCGDVGLLIVEGDGWREVRMWGAWSVRVPAPPA
jgi:hypothetical protein